jgi:hypothetical protein
MGDVHCGLLFHRNVCGIKLGIGGKWNILIYIYISMYFELRGSKFMIEEGTWSK